MLTVLPQKAMSSNASGGDIIDQLRYLVNGSCMKSHYHELMFAWNPEKTFRRNEDLHCGT